MENKKRIYYLAVCAILVSLASSLSLVKVYTLPLGGSVTLLSMLPIVIISVMYGFKWGIGSAFVYSLIQLFFGITMDGLLGWGLTAQAVAGTFILDYLAAFTLIGFAGAFRQKGYAGICVGTALVLVGRFLCHLISGVILFASWNDWDNKWLYSFVYNGSYMLPELILTVIGTVLLFRLPQIKKLMKA